MEIPPTPTHPRLTHQWAQVDKKKKKDEDTTHPHPHPPEADTPADQLYAQVDTKKKKSMEKKVCEDSPRESGVVYSEVMQQTAPSAQVPAGYYTCTIET